MLSQSGRAIFITYPIMAVVATVAVALRYLSKARTQKKFAADDLLILAGLVLFYAYTIVFMYGLYDSGGTLVIAEMTSLDQLTAVLKWIWVSEIFMTIILTFVKASIVVWYWNIFAVNNSDIRIPMMVIGGLCLAWGLIALLIVIFQCTPVYAAWDMVANQTARCFSFGNLILGYETSNMVLDVAILVLPLRAVFKLKMNLSKKITVAGIFCLGAFVAITCIIRIIYMYNPHDPVKIDLYQGMLWSSIEMGIAIVCCCLPTLGRLLPGSGILPTLSRWFSSLRSGTRSSKDQKPSFVKNTWPMASHGTIPETESTRELHSRSSNGDASMKGPQFLTHQVQLSEPGYARY